MSVGIENDVEVAPIWGTTGSNQQLKFGESMAHHETTHASETLSASRARKILFSCVSLELVLDRDQTQAQLSYYGDNIPSCDDGDILLGS